ncbi:class I SAM-dependent methyltransferase [Novosphingobium sp. BL-8A]|uniref:O-methyltransferase n=1 Tax=Novosphingobium sp. BL-8A TaxID=3127639 RepID=UPI0037575DB2
MTTLTTTPVAPLLARLFEEADRLRAEMFRAFEGMSEQETTRLMQDKTAWREMYGTLREVPLPVSPESGRLLYMLARSGNARTIVEFGTSFGISTIHLAAALRDNGGGLVITTEFEPTKVEKARAHLAEAGLADLVEIRVGDALETLAEGLPDSVDLVLLDGAKSLYPDVLDRLESRLRPGAFVLADNADYCPEYLARVRAADGGYLSVPFADDVELSMKL